MQLVNPKDMPGVGTLNMSSVFVVVFLLLYIAASLSFCLYQYSITSPLDPSHKIEVNALWSSFVFCLHAFP